MAAAAALVLSSFSACSAIARALAGAFIFMLGLGELHQHLGLARAGLLDGRLEHLDGAGVVAHRDAQPGRGKQAVEAGGVAREGLPHLLEVGRRVLEAARLGRVPAQGQHDVGEELRSCAYSLTKRSPISVLLRMSRFSRAAENAP